jgi:putative nucleotidyltransferase with HDIG domain
MIRQLIKRIKPGGGLYRLKLCGGCALFFLAARLMNVNLIIPLFLLSLYWYFRCRRLSIKNARPLNLLFLLVIIFSGSYFICSSRLPALCIPFTLVPMLTTLLFNSLEISLLVTLAAAVTSSAVANTFVPPMLLFLISGISSSILVYGCRRRSTVIRAGLISGIIQVAALIFLDRFWLGSPQRYLILVLNGVVSSVVVMGILPVFEYLFKTVTNISLLELADFNHPLLQRLMQEAPGTYHHSLVVGNLSDSAAQAIGTNALLARIGAYYHDIGKLTKPGYFSENQDLAASKHDALPATMSKMIIMNHVKEGLELAKKYRLNPALADFIAEHHGNSLVYYFYRRALENLEDDQEVKEEGFRYPGPRPQNKETAIVLLADSVEAACRALKEPTPQRIGELARKVVNNKFIDGQLDECDLTLKDLEKISAVFTRVLSGIYRSRISYPEQESRAEHNHKKPSKENSHLSDKDKKPNP